MNEKRPEAKPKWSRRRSLGSRPWSVRKVARRSAWATGPPMQRMLAIAEPTSIRRVRANTRAASWRMSVLSPTSPSQCGITGRRLRFCVCEDRCDSATQATPKPSASASSTC